MKILLIGITHPVIKTLCDGLKNNYEIRYLHYRNLNIEFQEVEYHENIDMVISLAPIWEISKLLIKKNINFSNILAISSTSIMSKLESKNYNDRILSEKYTKGEKNIIELCKLKKANYLIYRTTMLWGLNYDKNISKLIKVAKKFHFLIYPYPSNGLRAPIHFKTLSDFLKIKIEQSINFKSKIVILSGNKRYALNQIIKKISKKYYSIMIPVYVPFMLIILINKIFKLNFFNSLLGFIERSSTDLDFHDYKNLPIEFIPQNDIENYF